MRLQEIPGFTVYKLWQSVYQRGHLEKLDKSRLVYVFDHYNIYYVVGMARKENPVLHELHEDGVIDYHYRPIADGFLHSRMAQHLVQLSTAIASHLSEDTAVLCYCNAGRNRSGLMNALILRALLTVSGKEALEIVRRERPRAVDNIHFEKFLLELK